MEFRSKRLTLISLLLAISLILSYIEVLIPFSIAIPGFKVGLANIVIIYSLYTLSVYDTALISLVRVLIVSILFTSFMSLIFSLSGAILSLLVMYLLKRMNFGLIITSISGAIMHNVAQVIVAMILVDSAYMSAYMLPLLIIAIVSGCIIGIISGFIINRFKGYKYI